MFLTGWCHQECRAPSRSNRHPLLYENEHGFWLAPNLEWSPATYFVDSANTVRNDKYAVLDLKAGYDLDRLNFHLEAANLADRSYSGAVQVDNDLGRYFPPSNGRSIYGGISTRW